jgi:hypothetical protein
MGRERQDGACIGGIMSICAQDTPAIAADVAEGKPRKCLSCEDTFASLWAGERICKKCKQSSGWRAGISYKPGRVS